MNLGKKLGPLPRWGWLALGGAGAVGGYLYYRKQQQPPTDAGVNPDTGMPYGTPPGQQADYVATDTTPSGYLSLYGYGSGNYGGHFPPPQPSGPSLAEYLQFLKTSGLLPGSGPSPIHVPKPIGAPKPPPFKFPPKSPAAAKAQIWRLRYLLTITRDGRVRGIINSDIDLLRKWLKQHEHPHNHRRHHHHHSQSTSTGAAASRAEDHGPLPPIHTRIGGGR